MNNSTINPDVPDNCIILGVNVTIPWDNPHNLISFHDEQLIDRFKAAIFIPTLYLIGLPANIVNMVVFYRQGLKERINLCLFALAFVDIVYITAIFTFYAERIYTQFTTGEKYGSVYRYMMNNNVIGLYGFGYGPPLLSTIIATERCVCVLFPLQAQRCIPTKVLAAIIVVSVSLLGFLRFVITAQYTVTCFYEMATDRRSWQYYYNDYHHRNKAMLRILDGGLYGICMSLGCPIIVFITTAITVLRLLQTVRWRKDTTSTLSSKEIAVTKMLICLSIEFFLLSFPSVILRVLPVFVPYFSPSSLYGNCFRTVLSFAEMCSYTSSSVNFFVYYFTGSRYRETLLHIGR